MVMKQQVRRASDGRFLKYELDRYLGSRGTERDKELPLERVENQPLHPLPQGKRRDVRAAGLPWARTR